MSVYLVTYGKPRFLGIMRLSDDEADALDGEKLVIAQSHRGEEFAGIVGTLDEEQEREYRSIRSITEHGEGPARGGDPIVTDLEFVRLPDARDIEEIEEAEGSDKELLRDAQELVEWHGLKIKLIDAEMLPGGKKLFFYFTADQRVDFRTLVKDLARRFRTRIELRQMGVRDEARIIKGLATCGLPCCCSYWLNKLTPIGIRMVKEQNIALNPTKISGICGRLMCCMAFEHKTYKELWAGLPGPGTKIKAPQGIYMVASMDVAREAVRCFKPEGGDIAVPVRLFDEFREAVMRGEDWTVPEDAISDYDRRKCADCGKNTALDTFDFSEFERGSSSPERGAERPERQQDWHDTKKKKKKGAAGGSRRPQRPGGLFDARQVNRPQGEPGERPRPAPRRDYRREDAERGPMMNDGGDRRQRRRRRRPGGQSPQAHGGSD